MVQHHWLERSEAVRAPCQRGGTLHKECEGGEGGRVDNDKQYNLSGRE